MAKSWQQGQDSVVCTPLPLFLTPTETHRGSMLFHNTHQSTLNNYLFTLKKKLPKLYPLLGRIYLLLFATYMLCCIMQTVETVWPAVREWIIVNQLLRCGAAGHGNPLGIARAGGKKRRESLVGSRHLYKVEPAGWEQEGELFISAFFPLKRTVWEFHSALAGWMVDM